MQSIVNLRAFCSRVTTDDIPKMEAGQEHLFVTVIWHFFHWEFVYRPPKEFYSFSLSPNSDQQQFSPKNIHTFWKEMIVRINQMITKEKNALIFH